MLRGLFHNFKQGVKTLLGHHMGLVQDKDLVTVPGRGKTCPLTQFTGIIDTIMACSIDLNNINRARPICRKVPAAVALPAGMACGAFRTVDAPGQDTRRACFAAAARAGKQVSMGQPALIKSTFQRDGYLILTNDAIKCIRTVTPIKCKCHTTRLSIS